MVFLQSIIAFARLCVKNIGLLLTMANFSWYNDNMDKTFRPVLSIRIFGEEKCFGPGVAMLLHRVRELHSLRAAALSIGMAYSKAWTILKNAQQSLGFKLLDSTTGGKHGGGATLTPEGEKLLEVYDRYCEAVRGYAAQKFDQMFEGLL